MGAGSVYSFVRGAGPAGPGAGAPYSFVRQVIDIPGSGGAYSFTRGARFGFGTGPTFQGVAAELREEGTGPTFQGLADQLRDRGVSTTFQGNPGPFSPFSGPTGGPQALLAPGNSFSGTTEGKTLIPPAQTFYGPSGGQVPPQEPDHFGGPTGGDVIVSVRLFSGPTGGVSSAPPARHFGATTGGVVQGIPTPINLTATVIDAGCIRLDWVDVSGEETGYRLERSLADADDWEVIATLPEDTVTFLDRFAVPLTVYDYRVIGFDPDRESLPSNIATAVTPLPPDISTGPPPMAPEDPERNRIQPKPFTFESPGVYGLEKDEDGDVTGFKF